MRFSDVKQYECLVCVSNVGVRLEYGNIQNDRSSARLAFEPPINTQLSERYSYWRHGEVVLRST